MKHGGDIVASTLKQHNINYIFTLCGGHISPILVACVQNNIKVIDVRHEATGFLARALQHEMDHLNGILFWDSLGKIKRDILKRKFKKKLKEQEE